MKKLMLSFAMFLAMFMFCSCETSDEYNNDQNRRYGYDEYGQTYYWVVVNVSNQTSWDINVYKGDAFYCRLASGQSRSISEKLLGKQKLSISLQTACYTASYSFSLDYSEYNYVAYNDYAKVYR